MRRVPILSVLLVALLVTPAVLFGQQPEPTQQPEPPDQPGQAVARLGVINGEASVRRGDSGDWVAAVLNAPLLAGDSISVAPGGSVELQLDYANFVRIGGDSEVRISQLDNGRQQIQVSKGATPRAPGAPPTGDAPREQASPPCTALEPRAQWAHPCGGVRDAIGSSLCP